MKPCRALLVCMARLWAKSVSMLAPAVTAALLKSTNPLKRWSFPVSVSTRLRNSALTLEAKGGCCMAVLEGGLLTSPSWFGVMRAPVRVFRMTFGLIL